MCVCVYVCVCVCVCVCVVEGDCQHNLVQCEVTPTIQSVAFSFPGHCFNFSRAWLFGGMQLLMIHNYASHL